MPEPNMWQIFVRWWCSLVVFVAGVRVVEFGSKQFTHIRVGLNLLLVTFLVSVCSCSNTPQCDTRSTGSWFNGRHLLAGIQTQQDALDWIKLHGVDKRVGAGVKK